jgi:MFS superfamily sulfate permease-like transporter
VNEFSPRVLVIDGSAIPGFEYTALKALVDVEEKLRGQGVELWLAALNPEALALVRRTILAERLGPERMFFNVEDAVAAFQEKGTDPSSPHASSTRRLVIA